MTRLGVEVEAPRELLWWSRRTATTALTAIVNARTAVAATTLEQPGESYESERLVGPLPVPIEVCTIGPFAGRVNTTKCESHCI
jgi:hypothetical protein